MTTFQALPGHRGRIAPLLLAVLVLAGGLARPRPAAASDDFEFAVIDSGERTTLSMGDLDHMDALGRLRDEARTTASAVLVLAGRPRVRRPRPGGRGPRARWSRRCGNSGRSRGSWARSRASSGAPAGATPGRCKGARGCSRRASRSRPGARRREGPRRPRRDAWGAAGDHAPVGRSVGRAARARRSPARARRAASRAWPPAVGYSSTRLSGLREIAEAAIASGAAQRLRD